MSNKGLGGFFEMLWETQSAMVCPLVHSESLFEFTNQSFDQQFVDSSNKEYKIWVNVVGYKRSQKGEFLRV